MNKLLPMPQSYWVSVQQVSLRGCPDVLGVVNGTFVALEFKKSGKGLSEKRAKLQGYYLEKIRQANGKAFFIFPENEQLVLKQIKELYN